MSERICRWEPPGELPHGSLRVAVSTFRNVKDRTPRTGHTPWARLAERLQTWEVRESKDGPLWSPNLYSPGASRGIAGVVEVSCLVADVDHNESPETLDAVAAALGEFEYVMHSTHSWRSGNYACRWVAPLARPVPAAEYPGVWRRWREFICRAGVHLDESCSDASRIYYLPSTPTGEPVGWYNPGRLITIEDLPEVAAREVRVAPAGTTDAAPTAQRIFDEAIRRAVVGQRNTTALWLACQLRDNGYPEDVARVWVTRFCDAQGADFTIEEGEHALQQAFRREPRQPWRPSRPLTPQQRRRLEERMFRAAGS